MHTLSDGTTVRGPGDLLDLPTGRLLEIYNELTGRQTKKFSSRTAGVEQTWKAIVSGLENGSLGVGGETERAVDEALEDSGVDGHRFDEAPEEPKRRTRRVRFDCQPLAEQRPPREGTKRGIVHSLLQSGATVEEVMEATGWSSRYAREAIRLLHSMHGYGLRQDEDGRVTVWS